jgi:AcrR family transcriptional regulator
MARAKSNKGSRTGDATGMRRATAPKQRRAGARQTCGDHDAPKQTYHHGALKEGLVAAGEAVLADRGLQGFTLRECARRAGVSHAAPKHHFGDVRGLLTEIAARGFAQLTRRLRSKIRTAGDDLDAQFIATVDAYLGFAEAFPEHFRIMFRSDLVDVHAPNLIRAAQQTFIELTNVIHRQHREPEVDTEAVDLPSMSIPVINDIVLGWSHVHGLAHLKVEGQLAMIPKAVLKDAMVSAARRIAPLMRPS